MAAQIFTGITERRMTVKSLCCRQKDMACIADAGKKTNM
jgi:hypothetical protein